MRYIAASSGDVRCAAAYLENLAGDFHDLITRVDVSWWLLFPKDPGNVCLIDKPPLRALIEFQRQSHTYYIKSSGRERKHPDEFHLARGRVRDLLSALFDCTIERSRVSNRWADRLISVIGPRYKADEWKSNGPF